MKIYLFYLLIPVVLVLFSQTSVQLEKEIIVEHVDDYNIDSIKRKSEIIKQEILEDTDLFKTQVDSIKTLTMLLIEEAKHLEKDTIFIEKGDSMVLKKKGWLKKTIDKIKNK